MGKCQTSKFFQLLNMVDVLPYVQADLITLADVSAYDTVADVIALVDVIAIFIITLYFGGRCYSHKEDVLSFLIYSQADIIASYLWQMLRLHLFG